MEGTDKHENECIEDKNQVSMRFDIKLYSPAKIIPFNFVYNELNVAVKQEEKFLTISYDKKLPRKLVDDIEGNRNNASQYVIGYIYPILKLVNREMLQQRYTRGHFLINTFSIFDIHYIKLTNIDENPTDEIISVPWPPIISDLPYQLLPQSSPYTEIFIKDYIDACNDFFRENYENCIRRIITSVENAFYFFNLNQNKKNLLWHFVPKCLKISSFRRTVKILRSKSTFPGQKIILDNLLFLYKVRNEIVHDSLRIDPENGGGLCGKALKTVQYIYQCIDNNHDRAMYVSNIYGLLGLIFIHCKGCTLEKDQIMAELINNKTTKKDKFVINNEEDMNKWQFDCLLINKRERTCILKNKNREM